MLKRLMMAALFLVPLFASAQTLTCDGVTDNSSALSANVPSITVPQSSAECLVSSDTIATADLTFAGGVIDVAQGVTLTLNGDLIAGHKVVFDGPGTVIVNRGIIDVAWFAGSDASSKTAFALRGVSNTNGTGKTLAYYPPQPGDTWATTSANNQWGQCWKVASPIDLEQAQAYTAYLTYSCFDATALMDSVFLLGNGTYKADGQNFPLRLKIDGGNGLASWAMRVRGASHLNIAYMEAYYTGGIAFTPNGNKQVSDVQVGFLDTGELYNQAILMDGSTSISNSITDVEIGLVSSTGFVSGRSVDSVVRIGSNTNQISIRKVIERAVNTSFVDATEAVILVTNGGGAGTTLVSPRYGINIGPVINGSLSQSAEAVVVADASSGTAAKMTGITIESGSENDASSAPGNSTISLNYTVGAVVQGLPAASAANAAQLLTINPSSSGTLVYGMTPNQVTDLGVATLINGHNSGPVKSVAVTASPMTWTNPYDYDVDFQLQGGTVTAVNYIRGSTPLSAYNGPSLGQGMFLLSPGDSIKVYYSGVSPSANVIPR